MVDMDAYWTGPIDGRREVADKEMNYHFTVKQCVNCKFSATDRTLKQRPLFCEYMIDAYGMPVEDVYVDRHTTCNKWEPIEDWEREQ